MACFGFKGNPTPKEQGYLLAVMTQANNLTEEETLHTLVFYFLCYAATIGPISFAQSQPCYGWRDPSLCPWSKCEPFSQYIKFNWTLIVILQDQSLPSAKLCIKETKITQKLLNESRAEGPSLQQRARKRWKKVRSLIPTYPSLFLATIIRI